MTLYHTTHGTLNLHSGLCLTDSEYATYGENRVEVELDTDGLEVMDVEVSRADRDENIWPGDSKASREAYMAEGADVIRYNDEDDQGRQHTTYRILSARGLAALRVVA